MASLTHRTLLAVCIDLLLFGVLAQDGVDLTSTAVVDITLTNNTTLRQRNLTKGSIYRSQSTVNPKLTKLPMIKSFYSFNAMPEVIESPVLTARYPKFKAMAELKYLSVENKKIIVRNVTKTVLLTDRSLVLNVTDMFVPTNRKVRRTTHTKLPVTTIPLRIANTMTRSKVDSTKSSLFNASKNTVQINNTGTRNQTSITAFADTTSLAYSKTPRNTLTTTSPSSHPSMAIFPVKTVTDFIASHSSKAHITKMGYVLSSPTRRASTSSVKSNNLPSVPLYEEKASRKKTKHKYDDSHDSWAIAVAVGGGLAVVAILLAAIIVVFKCTLRSRYTSRYSIRKAEEKADMLKSSLTVTNSNTDKLAVNDDTSGPELPSDFMTLMIQETDV